MTIDEIINKVTSLCPPFAEARVVRDDIIAALIELKRDSLERQDDEQEAMVMKNVHITWKPNELLFSPVAPRHNGVIENVSFDVAPEIPGSVMFGPKVEGQWLDGKKTGEITMKPYYSFDTVLFEAKED